MSNDQKSNRSFGGLFLFLFSLVLLVWGLCLLISTGMIPEINKIIPVIPIKDYSELGSAMGIANGLFSALAIIMALYAIILQGRSLEEQRKALDLQWESLAEQKTANSIQINQIIIEQKYKRLSMIELMRDKTIKNIETDIQNFIFKYSKNTDKLNNINKIYSKLECFHLVDKEYNIDGRLISRKICSKKSFLKGIGTLVCEIVHQDKKFEFYKRINNVDISFFHINMYDKMSIYFRYQNEYVKLKKEVENLRKYNFKIVLNDH